MPRMIAYLGGDENTMVARRAYKHDVRMAVEFIDEQRMLVFVVTQTGELLLTWTATTKRERVDEMHLVGQVTEIGDSGRHILDVNSHATIIPVTPHITFDQQRTHPE